MSLTSTKELRAMQNEDLRKEVAAQHTLVVKLRMGVKMGKEKDSAKYVRERKQLARMQTVLTEKSKTTPVIAKTAKKSSSVSSDSSVSSASAKTKVAKKKSSPKKS